MDKKTRRTIRKDLTVLTSVALLGLVCLSALTGLGMDDAEGILPLDDVHELAGYLMAMVAGLHVLLQLGAMRTYVAKRLRELGREAPRVNQP